MLSEAWSFEITSDFSMSLTVIVPNEWRVHFLSQTSKRNIMLAFHVVGFFVVLIPLWLMGERSSTHDVFFTFEDNAGRGNIGTACLVGLLGPIMSLIGGD